MHKRLDTLNSVWIALPVLLLFLFSATNVCVYADQEDEIEQQIEDAKQGGAVAPRRGNWVPVPMLISNPTIGTGLQAVLMYLHPKAEGDSRSQNATSGLTGLVTNTESWAVGMFHDNSWANDRYRFTGIAGYGELNLKYYGVGDSPFLSNNPIDYEFKLFVLAPKF
jgi:hypothetical protein